MRRHPVLAMAALAFAAACQDANAPAPAGFAPSTRLGSSTATLRTFYGPERFTRGRGGPETFTRTISTAGFEAPFVLHVRNGDPAGAHRLSSASITLDGVELLGESAFNQQASEWSLPVTLGASSTLVVRVASAPASYADVWIEGTPTATVFCPGGPPGSVPDLSDAVAATPPGGTILVCDGVHDVDSVLIDKPLTIRAQHSGMATLRDVDPNPLGLGGRRPALIVNGVNAGLVRIADLNFVIRGSALVLGDFTCCQGPAGSWDQVEVDSVHVAGRIPGSVASFVIRAFPTTVPGAKLEVVRSHFEDIFLGIWAISGQVNVRSSTFDRTDRGIVYSNGIPSGWGIAERNVLRGCGIAGCIRVLGGGGVTVAENIVETGPTSTPRLGGIVVTTTVLSDHRTIVVENNTVIGQRRPDFPAEQSSGWTDQSGIRVQPSRPHTIIVRGNRVTDVWQGLMLSPVTGGSAQAHDNIITGGVFALDRSGRAEVVFTRNDATGQLRSILAGSYTNGHYRCNWWGSTAGPTLPDPAIPAAMYTPWAMQPIAGTTNYCDPTPP